MNKKYFIWVLIVVGLSMAAYFKLSGSDAHNTVESFGAPPTTTKMIEGDSWDQDGTQPEMASKSFVTSNGEAAIRQYFEEKCTELGFIKPSSDYIKMEPDMICRNRKGGTNTNIQLSVKCVANDCKSHLMVFVYH